MVKTEDQSSTDSAFQSCMCNSDAVDDSGIPFGPDTPALVTAEECISRKN